MTRGIFWLIKLGNSGRITPDVPAVNAGGTAPQHTATAAAGSCATSSIDGGVQVGLAARAAPLLLPLLPASSMGR